MSRWPIVLLLLTGCWSRRIAAGPVFPIVEAPGPAVALEGEVSFNLLYFTTGFRARAKLSGGFQQLALGPQFGLQAPILLPAERFLFMRLVGGVHVLQFDHQRGALGVSVGTPYLEPGVAVTLLEPSKDTMVLFTLAIPLEYNVRLNPGMGSGPMVGVLAGVEFMSVAK